MPVNKLLLALSFVLILFALIVALGNTFVTTWNVWACASLAAYLLAALVP
jgi:hypothetical protein